MTASSHNRTSPSGRFLTFLALKFLRSERPLRTHADILENGVVLGEDVKIKTDTIIGANAVIGDDTTINKGVYVCPGVTIGSVVTIGKNRLVDTNVPDGIVWNGTNDLPDPTICP